MTFRIGNIPIRIVPSFFIMAAVLGMSLPGVQLVAWVAVVLVSVIVHELGHATAGLAFGLEPSVVLHATGGTTSWRGTPKLSPAKRIAISLAGPGAGFVLGALALAVGFLARSPAYSTVAGGTSGVARFLILDLVYVNFWWGALNLLPMLPLDGGNVMAQTLNAVLKGRGERPARVISIVLAVAAVALAIAWRSYWPAFLGVSFVMVNWRALKDLAAAEHDAPLRASLQGAYAALDAKDVARVLELAKPVALKSQTALVRAEALHLLAFGFLLDDRLADADAAIAAMPKGFSPNQALVDLRQAVARQGAK